MDINNESEPQASARGQMKEQQTMHHHFFIQSNNSQSALASAREILLRGEEIVQVFFYGVGVTQLNDPKVCQAWLALDLKSGALKVCESYAEKYDLITLNTQFVFSGLVDFFAVHWQDQGSLVQFSSKME